jgi:hypothetical protein
MTLDMPDREKGTTMETTPHQRDARQAGRETDDALRVDMEPSARALFVAHDAHVREAMDSVGWERRGFLQRLTRRAA